MNENQAKGIVEKVKELVKKGNVSRVVVRRGQQEVLNISVNAGLVGGAVAFLAAKWVLLLGVLATVGFGCSVEVIKNDGEVVNVLKEEDSQKAREMAAGVVENVKDTVRGAVDDFEKVVSRDEPADEDCCCGTEEKDECCCNTEEKDECCCDDKTEE